jgi:predicted 2-oxoglutarate/Fe(II)-dependent dioxygenase YbiX
MPYGKFKVLPLEMRDQHYRRINEVLFIRSSRVIDSLLHEVGIFRDITTNYKPLYPQLFNANEMEYQNWFVPSFKEAIRKGTDSSLRSILNEETPLVYSFDLFTEQFCKYLTQEVKNFEDSPFPKSRPNSMNNYGVILNDIGMEPVFDKLLEIIKPLTAILYPQYAGDSVDHHHSFIVQYKMGKDLSLDMHTDDSEVTLNVNISDEFEGAPLNFCGFFGQTDQRRHQLTYIHQKGKAILHAGRHRHGAAEITSGERYNLIIWLRSSTFRQEEVRNYHRKDLVIKPDEVCLSKTHDPDYKLWKHTYNQQNSIN